MLLVSCRSQGMLTQGPAPDPKCKLEISSFLTLTLLLDCLICTRNFRPVVLLLWMMGGWDRWRVVDSYQGESGATGGGYYLIVFFFICAFVFWFLMCCFFFKWIQDDSCCVCFFVCYLFSLSPVPLIGVTGA